MSLRGASEPLCQGYDVALVDLDGVVYVGAEAVPGAASALAAVRVAGTRIAFVTNNASRTPEAVAAHLVSLGVPAVPEEVVTSAQAVASLLAARLPRGAPVLVTGGPGLRAAVAGAGLRVVSSADDAPAAAVAQGYDAGLTYADLAEVTLAVRAGAWWVAANLDLTMPSPRGQVPGNGALVAAVAAATGCEPMLVGKPERVLHDEAVRRTGAERPLVVGDRLDTDIEGAVRLGCDSLLVLTGVTDVATLAVAPPARRPAYVGVDLGALLRAHPAPAPAEDGSVRCGGWRAIATDGRLRLTGEGDYENAVRAAVVLAWIVADAGGALVGVAEELARVAG